MNTISKAVKTVEKEVIPTLVFPEREVIAIPEKQILRAKNLQVACDYGNEAQHKVAIYFEDMEGRKRVETTIWEVKQHEVLLKHNISIPMHRIVDVKF